MASSAELAGAAAASSQPLYLPDAAALQRAGIGSSALAPAAAQSMLAVSLATDQPARGEECGCHTSVLARLMQTAPCSWTYPIATQQDARAELSASMISLGASISRMCRSCRSNLTWKFHDPQGKAAAACCFCSATSRGGCRSASDRGLPPLHPSWEGHVCEACAQQILDYSSMLRSTIGTRLSFGFEQAVWSFQR